jgi:hypothetical protein
MRERASLKCPAGAEFVWDNAHRQDLWHNMAQDVGLIVPTRALEKTQHGYHHWVCESRPMAGPSACALGKTGRSGFRLRAGIV